MLFGVVSAADYFRKFWRRVDDVIKLRRRRELLALERAEQRLEKEAPSPAQWSAARGLWNRASGIKNYTG